MKGPRGRWRYDVRRLWECPVCHRREHTSGKVVNLACDCLAKQDPPQWTWMRLVEDEPKRLRRGRPDAPLPPSTDDHLPV